MLLLNVRNVEEIGFLTLRVLFTLVFVLPELLTTRFRQTVFLVVPIATIVYLSVSATCVFRVTI